VRSRHNRGYQLDSTQPSSGPDWWTVAGDDPADNAAPRLATARERVVRRDWPIVLPLATVAFALTFRLATSNSHVPPTITEGATIRAIVAVVPYIAAVLAGLALLRPWPAFLAIMVLTPFFDAAQVAWYTPGPGGFQVVLQTAFVLALGAGCLVSRRRRPASDRAELATEGPSVQTHRTGSRLSQRGIGALALTGFVALALASTYFSPNISQSRIVLAHGLLEPIGFGLIMLGLRPGRRDLALVAIALGVSAALGCLINIVQTEPWTHTLASLQAHRLDFTLLTYNNVGLLGELLAMAVPLIIGGIVARRSLGLATWLRWLLLIALVSCLAGMFLTFSKSAWLATAVAGTMLLLLAARTWRSRIAVTLAAGLVTAFVVPWPALLLQNDPALEKAYRGVMIELVGKSRLDSWNPATTAGEGSVMFRLRAAQAGLHMAVDHPLLGVGLQQYHRYYMAGYAIQPASSHINHAHSMWPELAAELGFPAMAFVAVIYGAALLALWRLYRNPPDAATRLLAATFMAALTAWVVSATAFGTDIYRVNRYMSSEMVMMAVVTAAAFALARYGRPRTAAPLPAERDPELAEFLFDKDVQPFERRRQVRPAVPDPEVVGGIGEERARQD
jgi:O-antigen ligase